MLLARESNDERAKPGRAALPVQRIEQRPAGEGWLACKACGSFVAEGRARISVNGAHVHSFINPAGAIYRVCCFADAPGLTAIGEASAQWTWFPGFEWQVGICRRCQDHLGWSYRGDNGGFAALIVDKLVERSGGGGPPPSQS